MPGGRERRQALREHRSRRFDSHRNWAAMGVRGASALVPGGPWGAAAGVIGEGIAQTIEPRKKYNFAQMGTQGALGAIPFGRVASIGRGAAKGATMGVGAGVATQQAEQGPHIPTTEDVRNLALPAVLGAGGGAVAGKFGSRGRSRAGAAASDLPTPPPAPATRVGDPASPRQIEPAELDAIRRSTLQGVRDIKTNPRNMTPRQSQAIADNLEGRFGTPEALESAAGIRRGLPSRDLSRAEGVMQGRAIDPVPQRGRLMDLPERNPSDMTIIEAQRLRRAGPQPLEDIKPVTPEVKLGSKTRRSKKRGKKRKSRSSRQKAAKPVDTTESLTPKNVIDDIDDLTPQASGSSAAPFSKVSDSDLKFLAGRGDKQAIAELKRRGSRQSLSSEIGAVGDIKRLRFGDRIRGERGALDISGRKKKTVPLVENAPGASKMLKRANARTPGFLNSYQTWVGSRSAAKVEGVLKRREFTGLDSEGLEGIKKFQQGLRGGQYNDIQNYFDAKHTAIKEKGVKLGFKENYLPQLWDNTAEEVQDAARRLGLKPKFAMKSVLENYEKGLAIGLKPKFTKISDLIGWYEQTANKAIADRKFFDWISKSNLIKPGGTVPRNGTWSPLNAEHFPVQKFKGQTKVYTQDLWAPKDVAGIINNYLEPPRGEILGKIADTASIAKNFALSSGIPKTGINAHGFNILVRNIMARGVVKGGKEAGGFILNPKSAFKDLEKNLHRAPFFMKHGLKMTTEGFEFGESSAATLTSRLDPVKHPIASKIANPLAAGQEKLLKLHGEYFEKPLFQEILPALKLRHAEDFFQELKGKGMNESAAARASSQATNDLYGGINWEAMGRSREVQNMMRAVILAPDWLETNARIGANLIKGFNNPNSPKGLVFKRVGKNLLAAYAAANVANVATSGKPMWDNDPGHALDIDMGEADGKTIYLRPFGTAADFARLPADAIFSALKKDLGQGFQILRNRFSLLLSSATNLATQRNRFGRKIFGKDDFGNDIPVDKQIASGLGELGDIVAPPYVQNPVKLATGDIGPVEAITGGIESPVRFASKGAGSRRRRTRSRRSRRR